MSALSIRGWIDLLKPVDKGAILLSELCSMESGQILVGKDQNRAFLS